MGPKRKKKLDMHSEYLCDEFVPVPLSNCYEEYERTEGNISVVGSLTKHVSYWEDIGAPEHILNLIKHGYTMPLKYLPAKKFMQNNFSSRSDPEFVREAISELLQMGAVVETYGPAEVVNPLTVSSKNGKKRLVLDLRHVNKAIMLDRCKIEGSETLAKYLHDSQYMFGFDLNSAGFVFIKVLRTLVRLWRSMAIQVVVFYDDGIAASNTWEIAWQHSLYVKGSLLQAGYIPNVKKSQWFPVQCMAWLGFWHDLFSRLILASEEKLDGVITLLNTCIPQRSVHIRVLARLAGSIIALHPAYGDLVYLKSKCIQRVIAVGQQVSWDTYVRIDRYAKEEMHFWRHYIPNHNGMSILQPIASAAVSFSDASGTGLASIITASPDHQKILTHREFSVKEKKASSTYRELVAVYHGLETTKHLLRDQAIRWHTDAKNVVTIVRKGSMNPTLAKIALLIYQITKEYNIRLSLSWIPREENQEADDFSRIIDYDDYGVQEMWFRYITQSLGDVTIDRFADHNNTKCVRFNSRFYCKQAEAVDAFTQPWAQDINWLVPPLYLVARTIRYLEMEKAKGILVVPLWVSAHFWPVLQQILDNGNDVVTGQLIMGNIYRHYGNEKSLFGSAQWKGKTLAVGLDFSLQ